MLFCKKVGSANRISGQQGKGAIEQIIEHSYKTDPRSLLPAHANTQKGPPTDDHRITISEG